MTKKKEITILISLVVLLVILNYNFLDSKVESFFLGDQSEKTVVERIIDGDTIVTEIGNVRLLGINTPER
jgi:endonuclease YncB( thermonuclease family)